MSYLWKTPKKLTIKKKEEKLRELEDEWKALDYKLYGYTAIDPITLDPRLIRMSEEIQELKDEIEKDKKKLEDEEKEESLENEKLPIPHPECPICLENIKLDKGYSVCPHNWHKFHTKCVDAIPSVDAEGNKSCPICRTKGKFVKLEPAKKRSGGKTRKTRKTKKTRKTRKTKRKRRM